MYVKYTHSWIGSYNEMILLNELLGWSNWFI